MAVRENLEELLQQAEKHFSVEFETLNIDNAPLYVLNITNMRQHLDTMLAKHSIKDPLKDLPLWAKVWPASFVLGRFLRKLEPEGKSLLEIGAGCGITSCIASRYGFSHITVSDVVDNALLFAKANIVRNSLQENMDVTYIDVKTTHPDKQFDFIAASEILYLDELHRPLLRFIDRHLSPTGKAVFCTDWLRKKPHFTKLASKSFNITEGRIGVKSAGEDGKEVRRLYLVQILERHA